MAFDFDVTGNTKLDTSGFTNGISSMTVAAGNLIADFVKSASSKMAELVTSSVDIGASFVVTGALTDADVILYVTDTVEQSERSAEIVDSIRRSGIPTVAVAYLSQFLLSPFHQSWEFLPHHPRQLSGS